MREEATKDDLLLMDVGEELLIQEIMKCISKDERLLDGLGHDSAFLDVCLDGDEILLVNTDRSGLNIAYKLGLANGECVGDFAVSHAVSDIYASGGVPIAVTVALLLPPNLKLSFVKELMIGADKAARKYGAFIASGDTKHGDKFAIVVTAIGKCKRSERITRSGACAGDQVVVTGYCGDMIAGLASLKKCIAVDDRERQIFENSLIYQNPPYKLSRLLNKKSVIKACIDNSDGLAGSIYSLAESSGVGVVIDYSSIPIRGETLRVAKKLGVDPFQFCLASGDWQHIYAVSKKDLPALQALSEMSGVEVTRIGEFTEGAKILLKREKKLYEFPRIFNDRFGVGGSKYFDMLMTRNSIKLKDAELC